MNTVSLLADNANSNGGNVMAGLLLIVGIGWLLVWLFGSKPKGYRFRSETRGSVVPRR